MHLFSHGAAHRIEGRLLVIERLLLLALNKEDEAMSLTDDLGDHIDSLSTAVGQLTSLCDAQFAALQAQVTNPDPAKLAEDITKLQAQQDAIAATLTRDALPAPTPAPTPAPPDPGAP